MMLEPEKSDGDTPVSRPFPWHCPKCRNKEVRPASIAYHTERLHEGRLYTVDVPQLMVPRCGHCGELVFNYAAEEQILKALKARESSADPGANGAGPGGSPVGSIG